MITSPIESAPMALPRGLAFLVLAVAMTIPDFVSAQAATLKGKVIDSELGEAIPAALVRIKGAGSPITADSAGGFSIAEVKPGEIEITVQAMGFESKSWKFTVQAGQAINRNFALDFTGEKLPDVVVTARANKLVPRYTDFERRRGRGIGAFLRWDDIKQKNYNTLGEAARSVRGVKLVCNQQDFECNIRMARTPNCTPKWYVDGVQVTSFHENTPIRDIYGMELYRGPSELPAEFSGSDGGCGVLVIWSKSKPYR